MNIIYRFKDYIDPLTKYIIRIGPKSGRTLLIEETRAESLADSAAPCTLIDDAHLWVVTVTGPYDLFEANRLAHRYINNIIKARNQDVDEPTEWVCSECAWRGDVDAVIAEPVIEPYSGQVYRYSCPKCYREALPRN